MKSVVARLSTGVVLLALVSAFSAGLSCKPPPGTTSHPDAATACNADTDCSSDGTSVCIAGTCRPNTCSPDANDCPEGEVCDPLHLVCMPGDAGPGTDGGPTSDGGASCTTKDDCMFGLACDNGTCGPAPGSCSSDSQCARGTICNFNQQCAVGCDSDADCMSPATCNMTSFTCVTSCSSSNPCPSGQTCSNGTCTAAGMCTSSVGCNSTSAGSICQTNGTCGPCTSNSDCSVTPYGNTFSCVAGVCSAGSTGCTSNSMCTGNPTGTVCDVSTGTCVQCNSASDCPNSGATCVGNVCQGGTSVCSQPCTAPTPVCDTVTTDATYGQCVACLTNSDCPGGGMCITGTCTGGQSGDGGSGSCSGMVLPIGNPIFCLVFCAAAMGTCDSAGNCCL